MKVVFGRFASIFNIKNLSMIKIDEVTKKTIGEQEVEKKIPGENIPSLQRLGDNEEVGGTHTVIEHNGLSLSALQQTNF